MTSTNKTVGISATCEVDTDWDAGLTHWHIEDQDEESDENMQHVLTEVSMIYCANMCGTNWITNQI